MKIHRLIMVMVICFVSPALQADPFDTYLEDISVRTDGGGSRSADGDRRGYLTGGNVRIRFKGSKFRNTDVYRVTAPSWELGCGGVDLHLGAFSHISSDAFVEMLKSLLSPDMVAYAFKLALNQFCEDCASLIAGFEKTLNSFNKMFKTSCEERGRMLYESAGKPMGQYAVDKFRQLAAINPFSDKDQNETNTDPQAPAEALDEAPEKEKGNIVFNFIKEENLRQKLGLPLEEEQLQNLVLSFMGTHLILEGENDPTQTSGATGTPGGKTLEPNLDSILPLLQGGAAIKGLKCENPTEGCTEVTANEEIIKFDADDTLKQRLVRKFSSGTPESIIDKFLVHSDGIQLEAEDRKIVALLGRYSSLNHMVYNAVASGNGWPAMFADAAADILAVELAFQFVKDVSIMGREIAQELEMNEKYIANIESSREKLLVELNQYRTDSRQRLLAASEIILNASKRRN